MTRRATASGWTSGLRRTWPALVFLISASIMLTSMLGDPRIVPFHLVRSSGFFDLRIYRGAARVVSAGKSLYGARFQQGFGFTYPPIAALMFLMLGVLPLRIDEIAVASVNVVLVLVISATTVQLRRVPVDEVVPRRRDGAVWLLAAIALWTEPVVSAIGFGQIDLLVAALVLVDLTIGERSSCGGFGIGLATALKLTPLVFIPYLLFTGRARMAARALGVFALSIELSFAIVPGDASDYWGRALFDTSRVTGQRLYAGRGPANQSLRGALLRIAPCTVHRPEVWLLACVLVGGAALLLAIRAARRGDEQWGFVLTAVTGLLICPVSWTHHWAIAVPGVLLLLSRPRISIPRRLGAAALALGSSASSIEITRDAGGGHLGVVGLLLGDLYVLAGLGAIAYAGVIELRRSAVGTRLVEVTLSCRLPGQRLRPPPGHPGGGLRVIPTGKRPAVDRQSAP